MANVVDLAGTVCSNRVENCPIPALDKTERGATDYRKDVKPGVILILWNDNNIVNMVSTVSGVYPIVKASRWSKAPKKRISIDQLKAIAMYNRGMGVLIFLIGTSVATEFHEMVVATVPIFCWYGYPICMVTVPSKWRQQSRPSHTVTI